jgi:hypothetical protein
MSGVTALLPIGGKVACGPIPVLDQIPQGSLANCRADLLQNVDSLDRDHSAPAQCARLRCLGELRVGTRSF